MEETEHELLIRATQMASQGLLLPQTDPDRIIQDIDLVDPASLRQKALMKGEIPRNSPSMVGAAKTPGKKGGG